MQKVAPDVDSYINEFPEEVQGRLHKLRSIIKFLVPAAKETISYAIPAYALKKSFVYFAGYKNHVALYPAPIEHADFKEKLAPYASGKGTVQFPNNKPLPETIVEEIVQFNVAAQESKAK